MRQVTALRPAAPGFAERPDTRVDFEPCAKRVRVMFGGETIADSTRARFPFETGLPTRYYIPAGDVRADPLAPTETRTRCLYEGEAVYWSADIGSARFEDVVWSYPAPVHESARIEDYLCFFDERVDEITVDGAPVDKPETKWSAR